LPDIITAFAVILAGVATWVSWFALKRTDQIASADLLLRLDERARSFDEIHRRLRPGGQWADGKRGPDTAQEWADVESYMGFFERMKYLVDRKLIGIDYVDRFYGYRYDNLIDHPEIRRQKLEGEERDSWQDILELGRQLEQRWPNRRR